MPTTLPLQPTGQVLTVPTSWADVSLSQFVYLLAPVKNEPRTAAELLCGLEPGALGQLAAQDAGYLLNLLDFATDPTPVTSLLPAVGLPDVASLPYGALLLCLQHLEAHADRPDLASLPYVLAVYRTQLRDGKLSDERISQTLRALLAAPVTDSYADGTHFLKACRNWQPGRPQTPPTKPSPATRNSTPTPTRGFLSGLGLRWPWTHSRAAMSPATPPCSTPTPTHVY